MRTDQAVTIGNVMIAGKPLEQFKGDYRLLQHERAHTTQWAIGVEVFLTSWLLFGGAQCNNPWERAAGLHGTGYENGPGC